MKKLLYLFIASTILISCNSNDDESLDPIIGEWQLTSTTENGVEVSSSCGRKSTVTFSSDGSFSQVEFYDDGNIDCESESSDSGATWENVGESNYKVITDESDNEENNTVKVNFSDNNSIFSITDAGEDEDGNTYTFSTTYKKI